MDIRLAVSDAEIDATYPVMCQLRPHIPNDGYVARVREMEATGFHLLYLARQDGRPSAVAGFRILDQLVSGRVLYVDDRVSDEQQRSHGHGAALMEWLHFPEPNCADAAAGAEMTLAMAQHTTAHIILLM